MKPTTEFQYFTAKVISTTQQIELNSMEDFRQYAELFNARAIFIISGENDIPSHFAVIHNGTLVQQAAQGFKSLKDYMESAKRHFPDAASYYDAMQMKYADYEDYKLVKEAGISDKLIFEKMKSQGFMTGYPEFTAVKAGQQDLPDTGEITNPYRLYQFANEKGFNSFEEFFKAWKKGFTDAGLYKVAIEKGFENAADYREAQKAGLNHADDLRFARKHKIRDQADFKKYMDLVYLGETGLPYDQRVLYVLISKLPDGKKVSFSKLTELYEKAMEDYRYTDTGNMPEWFSASFTGKESIIKFLTQNEQVKKFGYYDSDGEYFETMRLQQRKVVVDGSNVAHNSQGNSQSKPYYSNIIKLTQELKKRGFTEILIINDASLKHRASDPENMKDLQDITITAPAEKPADVFIIDYVKRHRCLLVSNDTFREWKIKDSWVAENIDYYRLSFLIDKDNVLLPDLK
ncbi:MAG: hypothetical protein ABI855_12180 [Bacteroidota bacterium]